MPDDATPEAVDRCPTCDRAECRTFALRAEMALTAADLPAGGWDEWRRTHGDRYVLLRERYEALLGQRECGPSVDWRTRLAAAESALTTERRTVEEALAKLDRAIGAFHASGMNDASAFFSAAGDVAARLRTLAGAR